MSEPRPRLTDSPWYWVYLFCTAGLVAVLLMGPRFAARQAQIEHNSQARQRAAWQVAGQASDTRLPPRTDTAITLGPLTVVLAILLASGWVGLCVTHIRRGRRGSLRRVSP